MNKIRLSIIEDKIKVETPYNEEFVTRSRNLRGKWEDGAWWFDDTIIDYVRELMLSCFGTTGESPYEECDLIVKDFTGYGACAPVKLFGRTVAYARGRNSGAKLGEDIVFISGEYDSGGSAKNWRTEVRNATFIIKGFPCPSITMSDVKAAIEAGWCEVKHLNKKRKLEEIQADIDKHNTVLAELKKELEDAQRS